MILQDKTAIVTGAGSGIGRAVAVAYAREGGRVIVSDISEQGGRETVRLIEEATPGARSVFVRADASNPDDHEMLVQAALDQFGALHVACNNAGIGGELNPVGDLSVNCWKTVVELNLSGVFYAMRAQIPRILPPRPPSARSDVTCHRAAMRMCGQRPLVGMMFLACQRQERGTIFLREGCSDTMSISLAQLRAHSVHSDPTSGGGRAMACRPIGLCPPERFSRGWSANRGARFTRVSAIRLCIAGAVERVRIPRTAALILTCQRGMGGRMLRSTA